MPYTKHNYQKGDELLASQLNDMDDQIALNEQTADILVTVSNTQPPEEKNRVWVKATPSEIEIPTMDDLDELKSTIDDFGIYKSASVTFTQGRIRSNDSGDADSAARIRSEYLAFNDVNAYVSSEAEYEFAVYASTSNAYVGVMQSDGTFAKQTDGTKLFYTQFFKPTNTHLNDYAYYRFVLRNKTNPSANIVPSEGANFHFWKRAIKLDETRIDALEQKTEEIDDSIIYTEDINLGTIAANKYINNNGNIYNYNGWSATQDFIPCDEFDTLIFTTSYSQTMAWNAWYKKASEGTDSFISQFIIKPGETVITPPATAKYFRISSTTAGMATVSAKGNKSIKSVISEIDSRVPPTETYLKVLTWNVGIFNDGSVRVPTADAPAQIAKLKKLVGGINADIFNAQEYSQYIDASNTVPSVPVMEFKYENKVGTSGSIAFSKLPVSNKAFKWFNADNTRGFWSYDITIAGKTVTIIDTHLSIEVDASVHRNAEIAELITFMGTKQYAVLTGDFNVYSDSEFDAFKTAGYTLCNGGDFGWFKTWPVNIEGSAWGSEHTDNIIVSSNIVPQYVDAPENPMSDHVPLYAELKIN